MYSRRVPWADGGVGIDGLTHWGFGARSPTPLSETQLLERIATALNTRTYERMQRQHRTDSAFNIARNRREIEEIGPCAAQAAWEDRMANRRERKLDAFFLVDSFSPGDAYRDEKEPLPPRIPPHPLYPLIECPRQKRKQTRSHVEKSIHPHCVLSFFASHVHNGTKFPHPPMLGWLVGLDKYSTARRHASRC
jgi:hypothetical protein